VRQLLQALLNPLAEMKSIAANSFIISQLTRREVEGQFRGTILGCLWMLARPLLQLSVYAFVFGVLWQRDLSGEPIGAFAMQLFCGLCLYNFFSQSILKSANSIAGRPVFVRQHDFPLEILPWVQLRSALILTLPWFALLIGGLLLVYGRIPPTAWMFPLWLIPLVGFAAGFSWFVASMGVYVRDLRQFLPVLMQMLFFVSPIFWQFRFLTGRKAALIPYLRLNPLATIVEESRKALIFGGDPDWRLWLVALVTSALVMHMGFVWFQKTRKGFPDVL